MGRKVDLTVTKALLAKLLATENLTVVHESIETAFFDLRDRVLHCPIFKDMTSNLYDLLMGHEVGHALYTPVEGWHNEIVRCKQNHEHEPSCYDVNFKGFLNVCEDARIEKKIKRKFNGLKKSFAAAYAELMDRDFFGVKGVDAANLNLIDRINLYFKVGSHYPVTFNQEEQKYVDQLEQAETWEDVVAVARAIYKYDAQQPKINNLSQLKNSKGKGQQDFTKPGRGQPGQGGQQGNQQGNKPGQGQGSGKDGKQGQGSGQQGNQSGKPGDKPGQGGQGQGDKPGQGKSQGGKGEGQSEKGEKEKSDQVGPMGGVNTDNSAPSSPQSVTDQSFRHNENQLVNTNQYERMINATFPKVNLDKVIYDNKTVVEYFERAMPATGKKVSEDILKFFMSKHKASIMHLLKEFEMRKNARQYMNIKVNRTGELDSEMLSEYKFRNDIFLTMTETIKGKSHGMVMFLDMSSSMNGDFMYHAIEQILILTAFCDKAHIPYDVYGFADNLEYPAKSKIDRYTTANDLFSRGPRDLVCNTPYFHLRHLISSRATGLMRKRSAQMLAMLAGLHTNSNRYSTAGQDTHPVRRLMGGVQFGSNGLGTSGTPLSECIITSRQIVEQFKATTKVDITNVIYLSDGNGSQIGMPPGQGSGNKLMITDPVTRKFKYVDNVSTSGYDESVKVQSALVSFVKELTGCRHICYYICSNSTVKSMGSKLKDKDARAEAEETAKKYGYVAVPMMGFDRYFYISTEFMGYNDDFTGKKVEGSTENLEKAFSNNMVAKKAQRAVMQQFAQDIATIDGLE